ncbi:hypothetical protein GGX14DRAFT_673064 [Mycena pura]|uniref:Uncharacterized protein n=1 Tax=Mycena pura TaxID=153505 RepID=A0AAD6V0C3_9AGAR|nr:hypothetical protein GGX14DRAFT_673064 [Mycena pura]
MAQALPEILALQAKHQDTHYAQGAHIAPARQLDLAPAQLSGLLPLGQNSQPVSYLQRSRIYSESHRQRLGISQDSATLSDPYTLVEDEPQSMLDWAPDWQLTQSMTNFDTAQYHSIGLSDMWTMDKAQVPAAPKIPSMDWTQDLQSQQATVVDTYEDFNQLQSPPLVAPLVGYKHKLSSQEAHAQTTFVHEDRPRKRAKGRKCRKCGITGCKGVGGAKWCLNPCLDCQRLDCQGRDASYPDVPCGGRSMFIQGSSQSTQ